MNPLPGMDYMKKMLDYYPDKHFDFHAHNDYDLRCRHAGPCSVAARACMSPSTVW
jgi:hypothetical protein